METKLNPYRAQRVRPPLPFKIIYTNTVLVSKSQSAGFKITECKPALVYMILNGKGCLTCGLHGIALWPYASVILSIYARNYVASTLMYSLSEGERTVYTCKEFCVYLLIVKSFCITKINNLYHLQC